MPSRSPQIGASLEKTLRRLGERLRAHRKRLGVSATATAEAAGMSRVTLYRIEQGEASVAMGAYMSVIASLGLALELTDGLANKTASKRSALKLPAKIRLTDYPQLKSIAWQLKPTKAISPEVAVDLYERTWRHIDFTAMSANERKLIETLLAAFGRERPLV